MTWHDGISQAEARETFLTQNDWVIQHLWPFMWGKEALSAYCRLIPDACFGLLICLMAQAEQYLDMDGCQTSIGSQGH